MAVQWLRLVAGLSPRRLRFNPRFFRLTFMVYEVALGQVFLRVIWISPATNCVSRVSVYFETLKWKYFSVKCSQISDGAFLF